MVPDHTLIWTGDRRHMTCTCPDDAQDHKPRPVSLCLLADADHARGQMRFEADYPP